MCGSFESEPDVATVEESSPEGLTLGDVQSGQTVTFNYDGGSNPGSKRRVRVESVSDPRDVWDAERGNYRQDRLVHGYDLDNEEPRQFYASKATNVRLAGERSEVRVYFEDAREELSEDATDTLYDVIQSMDGNGLASLFGKYRKAQSASFDPNTGEIVLVLERIRKTYKVPVKWEVYGVVKVDAFDGNEALELARNEDHNSAVEQGVIEDTFEVDESEFYERYPDDEE